MFWTKLGEVWVLSFFLTVKSRFKACKSIILKYEMNEGKFSFVRVIWSGDSDMSSVKLGLGTTKPDFRKKHTGPV